MQHVMSYDLPVPPAQTGMIFSRKPKANTETKISADGHPSPTFSQLTVPAALSFYPLYVKMNRSKFPNIIKF